MRVAAAGGVDRVVTGGPAGVAVASEVAVAPAAGFGPEMVAALAGAPDAAGGDTALRSRAPVAASAALDPVATARCGMVGVAAAALMRVIGVRVEDVTTRTTRQAARAAMPAPASPSWRGRIAGSRAPAGSRIPGQNAQRPSSMVA